MEEIFLNCKKKSMTLQLKIKDIFPDSKKKMEQPKTE